MKKLDKAIIKYHRLLADIQTSTDEYYTRALQRELKRTGSRVIELTKKHQAEIDASPYVH